MTDLPKNDEKRELFRIAAQRVIDDHAAGRRVQSDALAWARNLVAQIKPLGRALSTGDPVPDAEFPQPLRNGALEVF